MRSIRARFKEQELKNPFNGASINLVRAVRGKKFSRKSLVKAFNELIPEREYEKNEQKELIDYLENQTNLPEEGEIKGKNALGTV